jgi:hypothetical protein
VQSPDVRIGAAFGATDEVGLPSPMRDITPTPTNRLVPLVAGLVAGVPIVVAIIHGIASGWVPTGDDGTIATRALDVFTSNTPLTGVYSQASSVVALPLHSAGPMLYWLLAIPARFLPAVTMTVVVGVVNLLCVVGAVALAGRRGGVGLSIAAAVAVALTLNSLPAQSLHDIWNPSAGLLPLTALIFLSWSVACGDVWLLPLMALVASYAMQCHLTFVLPSLGLVVVALVFVGLNRRPGSGRWLVGGALVALVCWSFPIADELFHHPGNLTEIVRAGGGHGPTLGAVDGWHAVIRAVGIPPWWLRDSQGFGERIHDLLTPPGAIATLSTVVLLLAVVIVGVLGWKRGRRDAAAAQALSMVLCVSLVGVVGSGSGGVALLTNGYVSWWAAPAGMWVWLALGWGVAALTGPVRLTLPAPRALGAATLALLVVGVAVEALKGHPDPDQRLYGAMGTISSRLPSRAKSGTTRVEACRSGSQWLNGADLQTGVLFAMRRRGAHVVTEIAPQLSDRYRVIDDRYNTYLDIVAAAVAARGRVLAEVNVATAASPTEQQFKVLLAAKGAPPCSG